MTDSISLLTAQVSFLDPNLALIHIPIEFYPFFLQPVLRLLFGEDHDEEAPTIDWVNRHEFLNVSITPIECSVICTRDLAERFFRPLTELFNKIHSKGKDKVQIAKDDYIVIQVDGQGLDAGQRVLELTAPLAMAGVSILFVSTYFSDYIIVPYRARRVVRTTLEQRGFVFSKSADAFVSQLSPSSPVVTSHSRQHSSPTSHSLDTASTPSTPPARDVPELQSRTFARLKKNNIVPVADQTLRLISCAGSRDPDPTQRLQHDLTQVLLSTRPRSTSSQTPSTPDNRPDSSPRFLSLTLTANEPISVLLEHSLASRLGASLLGSKEDEDVLIPITLDLRELPMEATGIVCGVAGRLAQSTASDRQLDPESSTQGIGAIEISFLSTARAGTVIVKESEIERAVQALQHAVETLGREPEAS